MSAILAPVGVVLITLAIMAKALTVQVGWFDFGPVVLFADWAWFWVSMGTGLIAYQIYRNPVITGGVVVVVGVSMKFLLAGLGAGGA